MQQRTRRLAIVVGGTLIASVGLFLAACSTDNGTTPLPGQTDSGRPRTDTGTGSSSGEPETDAGSDAALSPDCSTAPQLRSNDKGFYCAFLPYDAGSAEDAGGASNCAHDETCCNPAKVGNDFPKTFCASTPRDNKGGTKGQEACAAQAAAKSSTWTADAGSTWECGDKNNCNAGQVCCLFTQPGLAADQKVNIGTNQDKSIPKSCNALQAFKYGGTRCAAGCGADEIPLCSKTDSCPDGKTCTPFEVYPGGRDLGYCK